MRSRISYTKEMRERADADSKELATVDCCLEGTRHTTQGPASEAASAFLVWVGVTCMKADDEDFKALTRSIKARLKKSRKREVPRG